MFLYGVVNASPDSLSTASIATTVDAAVARARSLLADGADAIDLGGQGSTDVAEVVDPAVEWERLADLVPALATLGVELSIDSWRPQVVRRALDAGATVINAADGMQHDEMWEVAAEFDVPIVVPFLSGPNPREMALVTRDPLRAMSEYFEARLAQADRYGARARCVLDPGTGFAPPGWPWERRFEYQKRVYSNLDELREFGLPIYIALPWKETAQHDELLEIVVDQRPEFGRAHHPAKIRRVQAERGVRPPAGDQT
ncbi:dihydropteroate synthase [Ilumatobacter sp.]|uniref:dihydropteroate synthase n=1 Tax=Ilumatobacter sp. TaxID=1967498 RepID=UPI003B52F4BC